MVHWTIRFALLCFVARIAGSLLWRRDPRWFAWSRNVWTLGCLLFLAHVASAFHFYHGWSHAHAFETTAAETYAQLGVRFGEGIYFSYLFALLWLGDVVWQWIAPLSYQARPAWLVITLVIYMMFIAFNGAIVFEAGVTRWVGIPITLGLVGLAAWRNVK